MSTPGGELYEQARARHRWEVPERYNIAADVCDARPPDALAMIHESPDGSVREVSWGELQALANRTANLLAGLGVERGDRVAVVLPPTPQAAAVFFATWKLGAILLSMSVLYGDEGPSQSCAISPIRILCAIQPRARGLGKRVKNVIPTPARRIRIVLHGAHAPLCLAGHGVHWDAAQEANIVPRSAGSANGDSLAQRFQVWRMPSLPTCTRI